MFVFGHIGLTIGLILVIIALLKKTDLIYKLDFRLIAVFALLPDIIDKVMGHVIFQEELNNGRLFGHTLVFLVIFAIVFIMLVGANWWVYTFPVIVHQLFDHLWNDLPIWLWPYYGWGFESRDIDLWTHWLSALLNNPYIQITELLGISVIIIIFAYFKIYSQKNFSYILRTGRLVEKNENEDH